MKIRSNRASDCWSIIVLPSVGQAIADGGERDAGERRESEVGHGSPSEGRDAESDGFDHPGRECGEAAEKTGTGHSRRRRKPIGPGEEPEEEGPGEVDGEGPR